MKPDALQRGAAVYSRRDGPNGLIIGFDDGAPFVELDNNGSVLRSATAAPVAPGGWHHLALTATPGLVTLYLDGSPYATLNGTLPSLSSVAALGGEAAGGAPAPSPPQPAANAIPPVAAAAPTGSGFAGDIDELEISKVARPAGFIKIASIGQGAEHEKLIGYGADEETASWLSGYFAVILKSVTLDGWVVIGVLIFMAIVSWIVMVDKAIFVNQQSKANARFKNFFRQVASDLSLLDRGAAEDISSLGGQIALADRKVVRYSSLYRIYCIGAKETRSRFPRCTGAEGPVAAIDRRHPRSARRGPGRRSATAQSPHGLADHSDIRRPVSGPARHGGRRDDHFRGDRRVAETSMSTRSRRASPPRWSPRSPASASRSRRCSATTI